MAHDGIMSTSTHSSGRLLRRPIDDRAIAGVASGLGRRFGVSPAWFRVGFILLTVFGGTGLVLYALGWLLIPEEGSDDPVIVEWIDGFDTSNTAMMIGVILIGVAVLVLVSSFHLFALSGKFVFAAILFVVGVLLYRGDLGSKGTKPRGPAADTEEVERDPGATMSADPSVGGRVESGAAVTAEAIPAPAAPPRTRPRRPRSILGRLTIAVLLIAVGTLAMLDISNILIPDPVHYAALTVGILGGGLLIGTLFGRARWLIIVGVVLTPVLFLTSLGAPTWSINGETGDRYIQVTTIDDLERVGYQYQHGAGVLEIDLRRFVAPADVPPDVFPIPINARVGLGELRIWLPDPPSASVKAEAGIGSVDILGYQSAGLGVSRREGTEFSDERVPMFSIDASVGIGSVVVTDHRQGWEG